MTVYQGTVLEYSSILSSHQFNLASRTRVKVKVKVKVVLGCSKNVASALNHMKRLTNLLKKEEVTQIHVTKRTGGTQLDIYHVPTFHVVSQRQIVSFFHQKL